MKKLIRHHSDDWQGLIFSDTTDPVPEDRGAPPPEETYGSPELPIHTKIQFWTAFNI